MEQNKHECIENIKVIYKKLGELGYKIIKTSKNDILCKTPRISPGGSNSSYSNSSSSNNTKCPYVSSDGKCTVDLSNGCPKPGCGVPKSACPLHGGGYYGNKNDENNNNTSTDYTEPDCLFRIRPSDTYAGLLLHCIILHGENNDLKMFFNYGKDGVNELISVINFLV